MATTAQYIEKLTDLKNDLVDNLVTQGVSATTDEALDTLVPKVLDIEGGGGGSTDEWQPEPDWWDIKSIIQNDNEINPNTGEPYGGKFIFLMSDYFDTTSIYNLSTFSTYKVYKIKTSDGAIYDSTNTSSSPTHTWDKSQDKPCSKGYKTRYIICYTDETWEHNQPYQYLPFQNNYDLYQIFDCNIYATANLSIQSSTVQCIEFINDKKIVLDTNYISMSGNTSIVEYRFNIELKKNVTYTGLFSNNVYCKKHPNFINQNYIGTLNSWFSSNRCLEKVENLDLSNLSGSTAMYNSFYNNTSLKKLINITLPTEYISYQEFLKDSLVREIQFNGTLNCTGSFRYGFSSIYAKTLNFEMDTSNVTTFQYFCYNCRFLETITSELDFSLSTSNSSAFYENQKLKNIKIKNLSSALNLSYSPNLTIESLEYLINNLKDLTGTTAQTLTLGTTNKNKLSTEILQVALDKNWSVA